MVNRISLDRDRGGIAVLFSVYETVGKKGYIIPEGIKFGIPNGNIGITGMLEYAPVNMKITGSIIRMHIRNPNMAAIKITVPDPPVQGIESAQEYSRSAAVREAASEDCAFGIHIWSRFDAHDQVFKYFVFMQGT
jgi:hypothetical protein